MKKRVYAIVLLLAVSISLAFAGGGSDSGTSSTGDGKMVLDVFYSQPPMIISVEDNEYTYLVEEKFNVEIDFMVVPSENRDEKLNLLLASGDYPSIFWSAEFDRAEQIKYGGQGVIIAINDAIEKYGPTIKSRFASHPEVKKQVTHKNGNIYGLPSVGGCYHCTMAQKLWINTEWLDAVGREMPTTTAEFEDVLRAFKTEDPNGNGKADEIPLSGSVQWWHADPQHYLMSAFIYDDGNKYLYVDNGKVGYSPIQPEWKEGLKYINGLYRKDLVDKQAFTQQKEQMRALGNNPDTIILGSFAAGHVGMAVSLDDIERYTQYRALPPPERPWRSADHRVLPTEFRHGAVCHKQQGHRGKDRQGNGDSGLELDSGRISVHRIRPGGNRLDLCKRGRYGA